MTVQLTYRVPPDVSVDDLSRALDDFWQEARTDSVLIQRLEKADVSPSDLEAVERESVIEVSQSGAGFGATAVLVVISPFLVKAAERVAEDVWEQIILPWLKNKFADDDVLTPADE